MIQQFHSSVSTHISVDKRTQGIIAYGAQTLETLPMTINRVKIIIYNEMHELQLR